MSLSHLASLIILTRNRKDELLDTLGHSVDSGGAPQIIVVDNASTDGTTETVSDRFPQVRVITTDRNEGAIARNRGILSAGTPFVAFNDDDSYFAPGSLERAVAYLQQLPDVGVVAARVMVGPEEQPDPTCQAMARSALGQRPGDPGPSILGFLACGFVARTEALRRVGGFDTALSGIGGEESLLALDLVAAGWRLIYAPDVVVHHYPSSVRNRDDRRRTVVRNDLVVVWMRRRPLGVIRRTVQIVAGSWGDRPARQGLLAAVREAPRVLARRRPLPHSIERSLQLLETSSRKVDAPSNGGRMSRR